MDSPTDRRCSCVQFADGGSFVQSKLGDAIVAAEKLRKEFIASLATESVERAKLESTLKEEDVNRLVSCCTTAVMGGMVLLTKLIYPRSRSFPSHQTRPSRVSSRHRETSTLALLDSLQEILKYPIADKSKQTNAMMTGKRGTLA